MVSQRRFFDNFRGKLVILFFPGNFSFFFEKLIRTRKNVSTYCTGILPNVLGRRYPLDLHSTIILSSVQLGGFSLGTSGSVFEVIQTFFFSRKTKRSTKHVLRHISMPYTSKQ